MKRTAVVRGADTPDRRQISNEVTTAANFGDMHDVELICGEEDVAALLKQHHADHPVHEFDFTLARLSFQIAEKYVALIRSVTDDALTAIPVLRCDAQIHLLINYIVVPQDAMAALLKVLTDRFGPVNIRTQRNYNNYSIFGKKTEIPDGFLARFDGGFDSYFESLGKKTRFNLRYYEQRLRENFPSLEIEFGGKRQLRSELFREFIDLAGKRYDRSYWTGFLKDEVYAKFRDCISCTIVRIDGKIAAFNIFYVFDDTLIFTGNTFDGAYSKFSLGFLTTFWSIRQACQDGFAKVILGPGDFGYKARLSNATETLYQYSLF